MSSDAVGQLSHALDGLVAAFADDVRGAELLGESDPGGMVAQQNDLLRAKAARGDDAAEADGPVADDGNDLPGAHLGGEGRMVPGTHHVGERQQRRHQRLVRVGRQSDERAVRLGNAHSLALTSVDTVEAVPASVEARGVDAFAAEDTGAVGPDERRNDQVAFLESLHLGTDRLDDADELMPHTAAGLVGLHRLVGPEIAAANGGARHR